MFPDDRFSRALDHLSQIYDGLRAELAHSESPRANDINSFVWATARYVEAELQVSGIQQARDRVEDALGVLDRSNPQRGTIVWALVNQMVDSQHKVWGRQMTGLMLILNWEYEAASEVFRPLWDRRTDYSPDDRFWRNFLVSMAHYSGCLAVGDVDGSPETVARWTRDAGLSGTASELIPAYLLDGPDKMEREDPPSAFHYLADSRAEEIGRIPTPTELDEYDPGKLCLHATGILLSELLNQDATMPFKSESIQNIEGRPDRTENPQLYDIDGVGRKLALKLSELGIQTVSDLQCLSRDELLDIKGIGSSTADTILADLDR